MSNLDDINMYYNSLQFPAPKWQLELQAGLFLDRLTRVNDLVSLVCKANTDAYNIRPTEATQERKEALDE